MALFASARVSSGETPDYFLTSDPSPATIAEAVNHYVAMGEKPAVRELQELSTSRGRDFRLGWRVGWICRVLFLPKGKEPLRPPMFGGSQLPDHGMPAESWPMYPLALSGKSYFVLSESYTLAGVSEAPGDYVNYCENHGMFRTVPVPVPNRLEALNDAAGLRESPEWKAIKWKDHGQGWSYEFAESGVWDRIEKQAQAVKEPWDAK